MAASGRSVGEPTKTGLVRSWPGSRSSPRPPSMSTRWMSHTRRRPMGSSAISWSPRWVAATYRSTSRRSSSRVPPPPAFVGERRLGPFDTGTGDGLPRDVRTQEQLRVVDELPEPLQLTEGCIRLRQGVYRPRVQLQRPRSRAWQKYQNAQRLAGSRMADPNCEAFEFRGIHPPTYKFSA